MIKVKAKFRCESVVDTDYGQDYSNRMVIFRAVYGENGENASFAKATPYGKLEMQIDKDVLAYNYFKPNKDYYLLIEEVES